MFIASLVFAFITLVTIAIISILNLNKVELSFFQFSLLDIASLCISILIGICVTYYISVVVAKKEKRKNLLMEALDMFLDSNLQIINNVFKEKYNTLTTSKRDWFLVSFTATRNNLDILKDLYINEKFIFSNEIEKAFDKFQQSVLTDDFLENKVFDDIYVAECINNYSQLKRYIFSEKFLLDKK